VQDQDFMQKLLPNGYHVCSIAVDSLQTIRNHMWSTGSVPVGSVRPWYAGLDDADDQTTDEFTAWYNITCLRLQIRPTVTDEQSINRIVGQMACDLIRLNGYSDDTANAIEAINAVLAGGAAFFRKWGMYPVHATRFIAYWLSKE
jgi:hypothetical protein